MLELGLFRERAGRLPITSWEVTVLIAIGVTGALAAVGFVGPVGPRAFVRWCPAIPVVTTLAGRGPRGLHLERVTASGYPAWVMLGGLGG